MLSFNSIQTSKIDHRGIGMIEALMAVTILSVGIIAIVTLFPLSLKVSRTAEQETIAANLAQAKIEEMFSIGFDNITIGTIEAKHRLATTSTNPFYDYQRQTTSEYVDANLNHSTSTTGMKKISVIMYWTPPQTTVEKNSSYIILISQK